MKVSNNKIKHYRVSKRHGPWKSTDGHTDIYSTEDPEIDMGIISLGGRVLGHTQDIMVSRETRYNVSRIWLGREDNLK